MGVPLAQGFVLSRPQPAMLAEVDLSTWLRERHGSRDRSGLGHRWNDRKPMGVETWEIEVRRRFREEPGVAHLTVTDPRGRPVGVVSRSRYLAGDRVLAEPLCTLKGESLAHVARRAMARPVETRLDAVTCCDEAGRYIASLEISQLIEILAEGFVDPV